MEQIRRQINQSDYFLADVVHVLIDGLYLMLFFFFSCKTMKIIHARTVGAEVLNINDFDVRYTCFVIMISAVTAAGDE